MPSTRANVIEVKGRCAVVSRVGDDVGVIGAIPEALVVGIAEVVPAPPLHPRRRERKKGLIALCASGRRPCAASPTQLQR
jgi:hypothetical protein